MLNNLFKKKMGKEEKNKEQENNDVNVALAPEALQESLLKKDAVKTAAERITKSKEEAQINAAIAVMNEVEWLESREANAMRKARAMEHVALTKTKAITALREEIKEGKVPYTDFEYKLEAIYREYAKKVSNIDRDFNKSLNDHDTVFENHSGKENVQNWKRRQARLNGYWY